MKIRILTYFFVGLVMVSLANAATIHGTIYDMSLKKIDNALVEINTLPKQFVVAQNGSYSFNVPYGDYTIKAQLMQKNTAVASVYENITIKQDGFYILDLILFPDIEEGVEEIDIEINENIIEADNYKNNFRIGFAILVLVLIIVGVYYIVKNKKQKVSIKTEGKKTEEKHEDDVLEQIIRIIKHEGGRATQKDIRKQIPLSEAKISLVIAELEHKGIIEKIKKGRGNIIILKKK